MQFFRPESGNPHKGEGFQEALAANWAFGRFSFQLKFERHVPWKEPESQAAPDGRKRVDSLDPIWSSLFAWNG